MSDDFYSGPWMIEYLEGESDTLIKRYISADYEVYPEEKVLEILQQVHPDWSIKKIYKVEKLPWRK